MNLRFARVIICAAMFVEVCPALTAYSQDSDGTTSIVIRVRDDIGGQIRGARIRIVPLSADFPTEQTTNSAGELSVRLVPGSYDLDVAATGFDKATKHIDIQDGADQTIEIVLHVGSFSDPFPVGPQWSTEQPPPGDLVAPVYVVLPNPKLLRCSVGACPQLWLDTNATPTAKYPRQLIVDFSDGSTITTPSGSLFDFPEGTPYGLRALYGKSVTVKELEAAINEHYRKWVYGDPTQAVKLWRVEPEGFVIQLTLQKNGPQVIYLPIATKSLPYKSRQ